MKIIIKVRIAGKGISMLAILFLIVVSIGCEEYKYVDLTKEFNRNIDTPEESNAISFLIDTLMIRHTLDQTGEEPQVYHQNLNIGLKISAKNNTKAPFQVYLNHSNYGVNTLLPNTNDTLRFTTGTNPSILSVKPGQTIKISLGSELYDFYGLFPKQEDYSEDMLKLIEKLRFIYSGDNGDFPLRFVTNTRIFTVNRTKNIW